MTPTDYGARYPKHEFRRVLTDFSLDAGRHPMGTGYRPLWRIRLNEGDPFMVGMCEMTVVGADLVQPGETCTVTWFFDPGVQGYIELMKPGDKAEICDGPLRIRTVHIREFQY